MPLILGTNSIKDTGFDVANSLRFNDGSSDHLNRTPSSSGNRKTWTWSSWVKKSTIGAGYQFLFSCTDASTSTGSIGTNYDGDNKIYFRDDLISLNLTPNAVHRDTSAWYHIVVALDTTQSTASNRAKMYINGTQVTSFATANYPNQDTDGTINLVSGSYVHRIGSYTASGNFFDGYLAEAVFIDGQALAPTSFGEFDEDTGIWKPKNVSGLTFGTNGFYLDFENSGALGNDAAGSNNFTVNNLTALDQSIDTCTNNFCTLNPLSADEMTFSNGNLDVDQASSGPRSDDNARGTIGVNSGKWYWETKLTGATAPCVVGICFDELKMGSDLSGSTGVYAIQNASATYAYRRENGTSAETSGFPNPVANNIMNVAFDADNGKLYLGINGTYYNQAGATGNPATGSNATFSSIDTSFFWLPWIESRGDNQQALMNFGSGTSYSISSGNADGEGYGNFEYSVPSGYYSLCTKNLAEYG